MGLKLQIATFDKCQVLQEATPAQPQDYRIWTEEIASPASKTTAQDMLNLTGSAYASTCPFCTGCWTGGRGRSLAKPACYFRDGNTHLEGFRHSSFPQQDLNNLERAFPITEMMQVKMPFGHYSVPYKGCLHFRQSKRNVYVGFLLLPHLPHLGSLLINLRETKRENFTILLSRPHPLHCPKVQLLENRMETTKGP